jgi:1-acyl-sn-glycerol-3-phosphate acyltransferase
MKIWTGSDYWFSHIKKVVNGLKKKEKWMKFRHRVVRNIAFLLLYPYCRLVYGLKAERFREQGDRPYLILYNHQTPFDQFFVGISFKGPVYYLATEDIFSNGWISSLIRWLIAPIPIKKQTTDISAVMKCIRVAREGGTIAIAPEGNRTYSGKTEYMNPAIAGLAKKLKLPIALYRIEGGYGVEPRWSDVIRRGHIHSYVSRVIEPEEYAGMSNEALIKEIEEGLYVNEAVADGTFKSGKRAEYLERAIFVCPYCGLSTFESHGNEMECKTCGKKITYGVDKVISGIGFDFPFRFVNDWYEYQKEFINKLDVTTMTETPIYQDSAKMSEVILNQHKVLLRKEAALKLYGNRITVDEGTQQQLVFPFDDAAAVTVLGRNKLNIYAGDHVYQFKGSKRFNALKYVYIFNRYKNISRGNEDGKFLGL